MPRSSSSFPKAWFQILQPYVKLHTDDHSPCWYPWLISPIYRKRARVCVCGRSVGSLLSRTPTHTYIYTYAHTYTHTHVLCPIAPHPLTSSLLFNRIAWGHACQGCRRKTCRIRASRRSNHHLPWSIIVPWMTISAILVKLGGSKTILV